MVCAVFNKWQFIQGHFRRGVRDAHEVRGRQEVVCLVQVESGVEKVKGADAPHPPAAAEGVEAQGTGFSSEIGAKLRDWAVGQAGAGCYSGAALSSNDYKTR